MRAVISSPSKYNFFDLARQLNNRDMLGAIMTGYPMSKLKDEADLASRIRTFPYFHIIYRAISGAFGWDLDYEDRKFFDYFVSRKMPQCDIFMGIAASCYKSAMVARERGAAIIVDRPCSHIVVQNRLIQAGGQKVGIPVDPIDPRVIDLELREYEFADLVTVPSNFAYKTFIEQGFPAEKLRTIPYGVDTTKFSPVGKLDPHEFKVLFVGLSSVRKGVPHLLKAFERLQHPRKKLVLIGDILPEMRETIRDYQQKLPIETLGHIHQSLLKEHMSVCNVFVLPSIEDGFGLVICQAMACGSPVIASAHTGAEMVLEQGQQGYIFEAGNDDELLERLQMLADNPELQQQMGASALEKIKEVDGWTVYGDGIVSMFKELRG